MKKKFIFLVVAASLSLRSISFAEEINAPQSENENAVSVSSVSQSIADSKLAQEPQSASQGSIGDIPIKEPPKLSVPVVEDPKLQQNKQEKSKKLDLRAVIFDPNADFTAEAKEENREMTKLEEAQYNIHEALHGEVCSVNDISRKGLLSKYLTWKPEWGVLDSLNVSTGYKGTFTNEWSGETYKNTLYNVDTLSTTMEGKFKDKKTSFRSMYLFNPGKPGHDFFNDVWGDQYIQYAWSKNDQVLFGYMRNTVGLEGSSGPWTLPMVNRSQIAKTYNNVRSLGVKAQGSHKLYDYSLAFASAGRYFLDWFPGPEFIGSFSVKPLGLTDGRYGKLLLGGGLDAGNGDGRFTVGSAYMDYEYKRLNATVEYGSADGANGSSGYTANQSEGFNGTIAYRITPKWQILARYDHFDPNKNKRNDIRREYTVGLNYFIKDQALKLQVNYTMYSVESGTYGSRLLVGTQILI